MKKNIIVWLRWMAVLPASFLAALAGYVLFKYAFIWAYSIDEDNSYIASILCSIASSVAFVVFGVKTAPSDKKITAYVLFTLFMLLSGAAIMLSIMQKDSFQLVRGIAGIIGGAIGLIVGKSEDT